MMGDYYCKSEYADSFSDTATEMVAERARLMSMVVRQAVTSGAMEYNSLAFVDGSSGSTLYEVVVPSSRATGSSRQQSSIVIPMGSYGILFEDGIYVKKTSNGVAGYTGSDCCIDAVTIFYL